MHPIFLNFLVLSGIMFWGVTLGQVIGWVLEPPRRDENPVMEISSHLLAWGRHKPPMLMFRDCCFFFCC